MGVLNSDEGRKEDDVYHYITLMKDQKLICRTKCHNPPVKTPHNLKIYDTVRKERMPFVSGLPSFSVWPACQSSRDQREWNVFLNFLRQHNMVAVLKSESCGFYILPPTKDSHLRFAKVAYRVEKSNCGLDDDISGSVEEFTDRSDSYIRRGGSATFHDKCSPTHKFPPEITPDTLESRSETCGRPQTSKKQDGLHENNYVRADPSYLKTLGHVHSGWIFGALAELVDNSKDAKATRLDISIETIYMTKASKEIPMLSVIDDGLGMTHNEILRMTCFGHRQPDGEEIDRIGRFGIGFKTGAMKLGRDALVLTQTTNSRSIAFLSQSLNEGKDYLEIPIVSYSRRGQSMELDTGVQSKALAKYNLKAIKEFSPFSKYLIGQKSALFKENGTGTQVYIWNLEEWGSGYCLEWKNGTSGGSSFHQGDILVRSRRIRSRPGQISQKVPLDYSLRAYLEIIFLNPRMKIYLQGSLVKSRPLAKSLKNTVVQNGHVMDTKVELIIGFSQLEWEQVNGGVFLYWHGRLIEAYKRVGGMIHNAGVGRGLIGVIDVSHLMDDANGHVWVHNNKQAFQDCEVYALLEEWLANKVNEYWDQNFDALQVKKGKGLYNPDHDWVQCDKCRKWRMLSPGFDTKSMPQQWFCYMPPFKGSCDTPEEKVEPGVVTIATSRSEYDQKQTPALCQNASLLKSCKAAGGNGEVDDSSQTVDDGLTPSSRKRYKDLTNSTEHDFKAASLKRLRKGLPRVCNAS